MKNTHVLIYNNILMKSRQNIIIMLCSIYNLKSDCSMRIRSDNGVFLCQIFSSHDVPFKHYGWFQFESSLGHTMFCRSVEKASEDRTVGIDALRCCRRVIGRGRWASSKERLEICAVAASAALGFMSCAGAPGACAWEDAELM